MRAFLTITAISVMTTACGQLVVPVDDLMGGSLAPAAPAALSLASGNASVDLGTLAVTALSPTQAFVFTNSGASSAVGCTTPALTNSTDFTVISTSCSTTLSAGASCTTNVRGQPSMTGPTNTTLTYTCANNGSPVTASSALTQTATPTLSGAAYGSSTFFNPATIGSYSTDIRQVSVNNWDSVDFTSCTPYLSNTTDFEVSTSNNTCGSTLVAHGTCGFEVKAKPTSSGTHTSIVGISCIDSGLFLWNSGSTAFSVDGGTPTLIWNATNPYSLAGTVSGSNVANSLNFQSQNATSTADATNCHHISVTGDTSQFVIDVSAFNNDVDTTSGMMGHFNTYGNVNVTSAPTAPGSYSINFSFTCDNNGVVPAQTINFVVNMTATP